MYPRRTPISHEASQRITYLNRIRRLGVYHARIKFGEFGPSLTEPVEPEYRPLPNGVTIDAKLGAYEEGFYSIAIKYLPRDEAVAITNIRVNADYARYLNFLRGLPTCEPTPREQIHPEIPLPAVLQHPTPRAPDWLMFLLRNCSTSVDKVAEGLRCVPKSTHHIISAIADTERRLSGVQFHPEVDITKNGRKMLHNFLFDICGLQRGFTLEKREQQYIDYVRRTVGRNKIVFMLESGGVDSAVCAALLYKALLQDDDSSRVHEIHIDNGFLR